MLPSFPLSPILLDLCTKTTYPRRQLRNWLFVERRWEERIRKHPNKRKAVGVSTPPFHTDVFDVLSGRTSHRLFLLWLRLLLSTGRQFRRHQSRAYALRLQSDIYNSELEGKQINENIFLFFCIYRWRMHGSLFDMRANDSHICLTGPLDKEINKCILI